MYTLIRRVCFYETDGMRVVYHGNYINWLEEARVEYLRLGGIDLNELMAEGIVFPVLEIHVKYLQSARFDDVVEVRTYLRKVDRASLAVDYELVRQRDGALLVKASSLSTYTDMKTGKIRRLSKEQVKKLVALSEEDR
ncbi:MAG: thioesterase family protein [Dialister sp.]|nr:thioesterase family protein [Dialister sp.]